MRKAISSFSLAFVVVAFVSLAFAPRAEALCEICRYEGSGVKVCQLTYDAMYWRTGRTDCGEGWPCMVPGECCYKTTSQQAACSVTHPDGCPTPKECGIREPLNQDF